MDGIPCAWPQWEVGVASMVRSALQHSSAPGMQCEGKCKRDMGFFELAFISDPGDVGELK